jgi:tetratricopeptide (TPR) repeat protein
MHKIIKHFNLIVLTVFIISGPATMQSFAQDDKRSQYEQHLEAGKQHFEAEDYASAMEEYQKAEELFPDEEEPKLRMQVIQTTLDLDSYNKIMEEVEKRKRQEEEAKKPKPVKKQPELKKDVTEEVFKSSGSSKKDSLRKAILKKYSDSLQVAAQTKDVIRKSLIYTIIADEFKEVGDQEMALKFYQDALVVEEEVGTVDLSHVYNGMAVSHFKSGNIDKSVKSYESTLEIKKKKGDKKGESEVLSDIGNVYEQSYDYDKAIDYYEKSAELKTNLDDKEGLSKVMDEMGNVYLKTKELKKSIESFEQTAKIIEGLEKEEDLGNTYNKLGVAHYELGNFKQAEDYYRGSLEILEKTNQKFEASMAQNNLGNIYFNQAKYEDAVKFYSDALEKKDEKVQPYSKSITLFNLGNAYRKMGWDNIAQKFFNQSKELAVKNDYSDLIAKNYKALSVVFESMDQPEKAEQYSSILDSVSLGTNVSIELPIAENTLNLNVEEAKEIVSVLPEEAIRRKEVFDLKAENTVKDFMIASLQQQLQNQQAKFKKATIFAIIGGGLLTVIIVLMLIFLRRNKK